MPGLVGSYETSFLLESDFSRLDIMQHNMHNPITELLLIDLVVEEI